MNFDTDIDRSQYPTLKWSRAFLAEHFGNADAIPMSVADMDLAAPPSVVRALRERAEHGVYGYEQRPESFFSALGKWYQGRYGWDWTPKRWSGFWRWRRKWRSARGTGLVERARGLRA